MGLFKTEMILLVLDIISENIPQLKALDLSDNKIYGLQHLSGVLLEKIPNLTILHLSKNRVSFFFIFTFNSIEGNINMNNYFSDKRNEYFRLFTRCSSC